jgi:prevent-host-death family protein
MATTTAREFQRKMGEFQHRARSEPVEITRHGRRELVLMSAEQYDWMRAVMQRSFRTEESPDFVIEAVRKAKMHPRHNHLDKLLK